MGTIAQALPMLLKQARMAVLHSDNGTWTYTLDNTAANVQALDGSDQVTDSFTFTASDNTTQVVTVTINGSDDSAVVKG